MGSLRPKVLRPRGSWGLLGFLRPRAYIFLGFQGPTTYRVFRVVEIFYYLPPLVYKPTHARTLRTTSGGLPYQTDTRTYTPHSQRGTTSPNRHTHVHSAQPAGDCLTKPTHARTLRTTSGGLPHQTDTRTYTPHSQRGTTLPSQHTHVHPTQPVGGCSPH